MPSWQSLGWHSGADFRCRLEFKPNRSKIVRICDIDPAPFVLSCSQISIQKLRPVYHDESVYKVHSIGVCTITAPSSSFASTLLSIPPQLNSVTKQGIVCHPPFNYCTPSPLPLPDSASMVDRHVIDHSRSRKPCMRKSICPCNLQSCR